MAETQYTQDGRIARLETPLGDDQLLLVSLSGEEALSRLFRFRVEAVAPPGTEIPFDQLLGAQVTLKLYGNADQPEQQTRKIHGLVRRIAHKESSSSLARYTLDIVPPVWPLTQNRRCRIFQSKSVPAILESVLGTYADCSRLSARPARNYCVQYGESDFAFALRLMEEEGMLFHFCSDSDTGRMILEDASPSIPGKPQSLHWQQSRSHSNDGQSLWGWACRQELRARSCASDDYAFQSPLAGLSKDKSIADSILVGNQSYSLHQAATKGISVYDYPSQCVKVYDSIAPSGGAEDLGTFSRQVYGQMDRLAKIGSERLASGAVLAKGKSDWMGAQPARAFELSNRSCEGTLLVVRVRHHLKLSDYESTTAATSDSTADALYENRLSFVPRLQSYLPKRRTRTPTIVGHQTATVVGYDGTTEPKNDHIFTDRYGRVRVHFHWAETEHNSCWVRVAQTWAGKGWGSVQIPRVGQEVIVGFADGDPDCPMIYGSVYNGQNMPPHQLPDLKHRSGMMSCTNGTTIGTSTVSSGSGGDSSTDTDSDSDTDSETYYSDSDNYSGMVIGDKDDDEYVHIRSADDLLIDAKGSIYQLTKSEHARIIEESELVLLGGLRGYEDYDWWGYTMSFGDDAWSPVTLHLNDNNSYSLRINFGSERVSTGSSSQDYGLVHNSNASTISTLGSISAIIYAIKGSMTGLALETNEAFSYLSMLGLNVAEIHQSSGDRYDQTSYRLLDRRDANNFTCTGLASPTTSPFSALSDTVFTVLWIVDAVIKFAEQIVEGVCDIRNGTTARTVVEDLVEIEQYYGNFLVAIEMIVTAVRKIETLATAGEKIASIATNLTTDTPVVSVDSAAGITKLASSLTKTLTDLTENLTASVNVTGFMSAAESYVNATKASTSADEYHYSSGSIIHDADEMIVLKTGSCMHSEVDELCSTNCGTYAMKSDYGIFGVGDAGFKLEHALGSLEAYLQAAWSSLEFVLGAQSSSATVDKLTLGYGTGATLFSNAAITLNVNDVSKITMNTAGILLSYGTSSITINEEGVTIAGLTNSIDSTTETAVSSPTVSKIS